MTIQERLEATQLRYDQAQTERNSHVQQANDLLTEMTKIEGEFRVLQELANEKEVKPNKKATAIEAVPEEKN